MKKSRVVVLHGEVPADAPQDEQDVLEEVREVGRALGELGFAAQPLPFTMQLDRMAARLRRLRPHFVFNLVETVAGDGQFVYLAPALLESLHLPYTGCPRDAMFLTSSKLLAKRVMAAAGVPTAPWLDAQAPGGRLPSLAGRFVVKLAWEHASIGLDEGAVVDVADARELLAIVRDRQRRGGKECFAERYIDGREFNVSMLSGAVLPIPEMTFVDFPDGKPRMVDYRAKWDEESFEFRNTRRLFDLPPEDQPLVAELEAIARRCWDLFGLRGYARVDFRVDRDNRPFVLEVNTNPCISPAAGLAAAAARRGLGYRELVEAIVRDAVRHPD